MGKKFYITTAIDYTNGAPHIGHTYEKVLADAMARFQRLDGKDVYFLTGVDQHGQKVQQSAEKAGVSPLEYVRDITSKFLAAWERLEVKPDGWVETTDVKHQRIVQNLLQQLYDAGQIYKKMTTGWYSVRQEQFLTDRERDANGQFGEEWGQVEEREEENYYFRLTDHLEWLRGFLAARPDFVFPPGRGTQLVNAAVESGADLCISRPKARLSWGIELPFDRDYVTFVWFDALTNYLSYAGFRDPDNGSSGLPRFDDLWPCDAHVIGKDILIPAHGIYWPIMLHAIGLSDAQMPRIVVHGWWNTRGEKMSKTLGNVIDPHDLADRIGPDGVRYYLLSEIATGQDADLSDERVLLRYNKDLADILGNLFNRTLNMAHKYLGGTLIATTHNSEMHRALRESVTSLPGKAREAMASWQVHKMLADCIDCARLANEFIDKTAPFKLAKDPANADAVASIMRHVAESLAHLSVLLSPVMPAATLRMQEQLGWSPSGTGPGQPFTLSDLKWGLLPDGHVLGRPQPLFPKVLAAADAGAGA